MQLFDDDQLEDVVYPEPPVPNYLQTIEFVAAANEVGKALGWRRPTAEEGRAMSAAFDKCLRESASDTPSIPGML